MHPLIVSGIISFFANLLIGSFVYWHNPKDRKHVFFFLFSLTVSGWSVGSFLENVIPDKALALTALRCSYLFGIWLPPIYLHFSYSLVRPERLHDRILKIAYGCSFLLTLIAFSPLFIRDLKALQTVPYPFFITAPGPLYYVFFLFFAIAVSEVLRTTLREMKVSSGQRYLQYKYLTVANAIAIAAGFEYFSRVFGLIKSPPFDDYILVLYLVVLAYAIVRHRLMDITVVIRRSLVYSILVAIITAIYLVIVMASERLLQGFVGYRSVFGSLLAALIIALGFNPVRNAVQRWVDRLFFGGSQEALAQENERLRDELTRSERLKSIALLAGGLAHEIKNPLAAMKTFIQYLPERHRDEAFIATCHRIVGQEIEKIQSIASNLLAFAKPETLRQEAVSLAKIAEEVLELLHRELLDRHIQARSDIEPGLTVQADRVRVKQALLNLCLNSIQAMESGGVLEIAARAEHSSILLTVHDTGQGIAPANLPRVFDPFFTTKSDGTGLGLSVVHSIVKQHGGAVRITSEPSRGTTVTLELPIRQTA